MKLSTTQDPAYLKECLAFHKRREFECSSSLHSHYNPERADYHARQVKWFEAKLRSPFRSSPVPAPAHSQMPAAGAHERYLERLALFQSQAQPVEEPKPAGLIARLWNRIRGL